MCPLAWLAFRGGDKPISVLDMENNVGKLVARFLSEP
jgi:hypothetical protein